MCPAEAIGFDMTARTNALDKLYLIRVTYIFYQVHLPLSCVVIDEVIDIQFRISPCAIIS